MEIRRRIVVAATAYADELSLRAFAEVSAVTADQNVRIVGGQMVSLLLGPFPCPGSSRAAPATPMPPSPPNSQAPGLVNDRLVEHGYTATSGNNYIRQVPDRAIPGGPVPELSVDLLVPSLDGRFHPQEHGGRAFDSAPGLAPALAAPPVVIETGARLLDGTMLEFDVRVPTVEFALVIKALSYGLTAAGSRCRRHLSPA